MVTGKLPWRSTNRIQIFEQISAGDIEIPLDISDECADLMMKCLRMNPEDRITAKEALQHPWLVSCPLGEPYNSCLPYVSLRRVDDFFSADEDDDIFAGLALTNSSALELTQTFPKVLAEITTVPPVDAHRSPMQKHTTCQSMLIPTAMVDQLPPAEIEELMQEFRLGQKKKAPKLVRPHVRTSRTDDRLPSLTIAIRRYRSSL
jgi:serine/threonine protein kinase